MVTVAVTGGAGQSQAISFSDPNKSRVFVNAAGVVTAADGRQYFYATPKQVAADVIPGYKTGLSSDELQRSINSALAAPTTGITDEPANHSTGFGVDANSERSERDVSLATATSADSDNASRVDQPETPSTILADEAI